MPFDRMYTLEEVHQLICDSEGRASPNTGADGHSLNLHGDLRSDLCDKRVKTVILLPATMEELVNGSPDQGFGKPIQPAKFQPKDGRFVSRKGVVLALHEALNSPTGQSELRKLGGTETRVSFEIKLARQVRGASVQHASANLGTKKKPNIVPAHGPSNYQEGLVDRIVVVVDKFPDPNPQCKIHIQTAYPKF